MRAADRYILGGMRRRVNAGGKKAMRGLCRGFLLCRAHGIEEMEKLLDACNFQSVAHSSVDADKGEAAMGVLPSDVCAYQRADARRIDVRDVREIENKSLRLVGANGGLKFKERGEHERAAQNQDAIPWLTSGLIRNTKGFLRHAGDINLGVIVNC